VSSAPNAQISFTAISVISSKHSSMKRETCIVGRKEIIGKAIFVIGRGGPWDCEMLRLPHFLHNRVTDGCEAVSLKR
jgi:hypothetical protein